MAAQLERSAVIVLNRRAGSAGGGDVDALSRRLAERLRSGGIAARSIAFDGTGATGGRWRQRLDDALGGAERVYVLGGDGTVLAVASALLTHAMPLGIVPLGTANLLARDLDIPLDPEAAIDVLADAPVRRIDVGRVNGEPFLCASMLGLTTDLARTREAARGVATWRLLPRMLTKAYWLLKRYPIRKVTLRLDNEQHLLRTRAIVITNNPVMPEATLYPRRERLDAGTLGVYCVREGPLHELPRLAIGLLNGTWPSDPRIFHASATAVSIKTNRPHRMTVMNDGERGRLTTPLHYEILPRALSVLAPRPQ
ncbi:MAG: hypothetical protein K9L70_09300 [Thiohalocapsa sp.]|nr:hypothetical protein [Thiohalocapsa sp.]MCF7991209.1 hypothetical protein [Thiohalocapsa sp.]